jgi:hypothetical protein
MTVNQLAADYRIPRFPEKKRVPPPLTAEEFEELRAANESVRRRDIEDGAVIRRKKGHSRECPESRFPRCRSGRQPRRL